jgi:hypothetical protein
MNGGVDTLKVVRTDATGGWSAGSVMDGVADLLAGPDAAPVVVTPVQPDPVVLPPVVTEPAPAPTPAPPAPVVAPPVVVAPVQPAPIVTPPIVVTPANPAAELHRVTGTAANETLNGTAARDTFYFDVTAGRTGVDTVRGFDANDILVTKRALVDNNKDGIITFGAGTLDLGDGASKLRLADVSKAGLRFLGATEDGFAYGEAAVRPKGAKEGKLGAADTLTGGSKDSATDKFFFDLDLGLSLGVDTVAKFGVKDVVITTAALGDGPAGSVIQAIDGYFTLGDDGVDLGSVAASDLAARAVTALEFDGARVIDGVEYYVYSSVGSAVGMEVLG